MNQNDTGTRRPPSSRSKWNAAQHRALRKELLILQSEVERLELAQAASEMRHAVTRFSWLKVFIPGLSSGKFSHSAKTLNASLGNLLNQYPMLSSVASLVLAKPMRSLLRATAGPALKWGTLGFAAWEAYRIWKQSRGERQVDTLRD
ncbi:DUF3318 domain-containing protein [Burkholderia multivorans]|uniref:DUF3318 domain-containing protein n=2 Tax=Burkholderia multivorans TaxID=87883 RepID=A0A0H3KCJ7_BURM1|nr:DUF3318 domain-containing protein [Burkholderia multivorans]ABX16258.1 conserved hypothetical protein [Burkholderia multivorans ATCC 17616]AOK66799.1 hypothetical protein WM33_14315 [Burkholderia multivorans]AYY58174.1 DUF3318 domain-containing protein [Burkholderia multivorans]AYY96451.1 DUF3318 domain-containing protein [Burkholderia multivorans]KGC08377.1 hypothetical protein DM81_5602 [Burkholderia multivorans]